MTNLVTFLFLSCITYNVYGYSLPALSGNTLSGTKIDLEALCKSGKHPVASEKTICAYWIGDANGSNEARLVHNKGINISLHGVFPASLKPKIPSVPYETFVVDLKRDLNLKHFIDVASSTNYTCCCSQYHEYTKHGSKSGYTYPEWLSEVKVCMDYIDSLRRDEFVKTCSPDFCHFNGTVNFVEECFIGDNGAHQGCKKGHPFVFPDV